jgi:general stress protein 26
MGSAEGRWRDRGKALLPALFLLSAGMTAAEVSSEDVLEAARAGMNRARHCFLITLDASGRPQARLMDPFEPEADLTVWMATHPATRKVGQLRNDSRATLAYFDAEGTGYVTLIGEGLLVDDPEERRRRWKPEWEPFYPDGPEGDDYLLIRFVPSRVEVMSLSDGIAADPQSWRPAILDRRDGVWVPGDSPRSGP